MEALFIVPAMVSPQVNEKLIPALSKMIERNIILNNASLFRSAALIKYSKYFSFTSLKENEIPVTILSDGIISENDTILHNFGKFILGESSKFVFSDDSTKSYEELIRMKDQLISDIRNEKDSKKRSDMQRNLNQLASTIVQQNLNRDKLKNDFEKIQSETDPKKREREEILFRNDLKKYEYDIKKLASGDYKDYMTGKKIASELKDRKADIRSGKRAKSRDLQTFNYGHSSSSLDSVENPTGIQFFTQISLEPTMLQIPIGIGRKDDVEERMITVGVKCIPYVIDDVTSILKLLNETKNMNWFERQFKNMFRKFNTKIWFTRRRAINKGHYINPDEAVESIKFAPTRDELSKVNTLAKKFNRRDSSSWTTMIILSSYDLQDNDALVDVVNNYRKLTKYVFGDIVITNETKESAYFCTPRLNHCQEIPFDYLKKVMNLKDVLDYSEAARATAWSKESRAKRSSVRRAISENVDYTNVKSKLEDIIKVF